MHLSIRAIQAINMFISSWALVFLAVGILVNDWVRINIETRATTKSHSPWIQSNIWSKGKNETLGRWVEREGSPFLDFHLLYQLTRYSLVQCPQAAMGPLFIIHTVKAEFKNLAMSNVLGMF